MLSIRRVKPVLRKAPRLLAAAALFYVILFGFVVIFQRAFIYFPNDRYRPPEHGEGAQIYQELAVTTADGIALKGWYAPARAGKPTLVFFHGNADSVAKMAPAGKAYSAAGYGFLVTEYRGYSGFDGTPSEEGLYADGRAFIEALLARGLASKDMVLFGHSLGTGVATQLALEYDIAGLILMGPYFSMSDMAGKRFPYFPGRYFLQDRFDNGAKIGAIDAPLLIVHGTADLVVPPEQGAALYERAKKPKELHLIPGGGHTNLFVAPYESINLRWLESLGAASSTASAS